MKKYEAIFIFDDQRLDDQGEAFLADFEQLVGQAGGTVHEKNSMGQRQMTYQIRRRNTGIYWSIVLDLPEDQPAAIKEHYRLTDSVLRLEFFVYDKPEVVCGKPADDEDND